MNHIESAPSGGLQRSEIITTIIGLMLGVLMSALDNTVVGTAMPKLVRDLGGLDLYSWPFTIYFLTSTLAIPVFGRLADQLGRRTIFLAGLSEFILASILCGLSPNMITFIIFRGLQGLGGGILISNAFALSGEIARPERRGAYAGMIAAMFGVAGLLGPSVGGLLADGPGWRWAFYINLPIGLAALAVLVFGLRHVKEQRTKPQLDIWGLSCFILAVSPLLLALSWGGREYPWTHPVILGLGGMALVFMVLFLRQEHRHPQTALLPPWLFGKADFTMAAAGIFLSNATFFGAILFLPLWIQTVLGNSASVSGLAMTPLLVSYTLAVVVGGQLIGKFKTLRWYCFGSGTVAVAGAIALTLIQSSMGLPSLAGAMVLLGLGLGAITPAIAMAAQNSVEPRFIGVATATNNFFRNLGASVGSAIFGSVFLQRLHDGLASVDWAQTPTGLKTALEDPNVLMSPAALRSIGEQVPAAWQSLFHQLMTQIVDKLALAINGVFLVMLVAAVLSLPVLLFIKGARPKSAPWSSASPPNQTEPGAIKNPS